VIVFIGMETSGALRRRFQARGHETYSCDLFPSEDGGDGHITGDVINALDDLQAAGKWPDLAIFHPTCTFLTGSAEWAYHDGPYHQKIKPATLVGSARRKARETSLDFVRQLMALPIRHKAIENPVGVIGTRIRPADQIIQPHQFGDDASKATCLWLTNLPPLVPTRQVAPRMVGDRPRWANQTDSGQNRLSPSDDRWKNRARTYPGIADAMAAQWGNL
jgi:hypothetical protein